MRALVTAFVLVTRLLVSAEAPKDPSPSPAVVRAAQDFSRVAEQMDASVVNISTTQYVRNRSPWDDFFGGMDPFMGAQGRTYKRQSLGSGFVFSADGQVITNAHVVAGADEIVVRTADGGEYKAEVLGADEAVDIALLKIEPKKPLLPAVLGDSANVKVGEWAIAIGNPFGFDHSLTVGVISAKERTNIFQGEGAAKYQNYLQTDASINHGNSGGPLCNISGEVIGMNTAISTPNEGSIGIGFAIPINFVKRSIPDLLRAGRVVAPSLGFIPQPLDARLAKALKLDNTRGVLVSDVIAGGVADKAGLKRGDVILKLGTKEVAGWDELKTRLYEAASGEALNLTVWRAGEKIGLRVEPSTIQASRDSGRWHGLEVELNSAAVAARRGLASDRGVVVSAVAAKSTADQIGVKVGDLLLTLNQQPVDSLDDWRKLTRAVDERQDAVVLLIRGRQKAYVVLPGEE